MITSIREGSKMGVRPAFARVTFTSAFPFPTLVETTVSSVPSLCSATALISRQDSPTVFTELLVTPAMRALPTIRTADMTRAGMVCSIVLPAASHLQRKHLAGSDAVRQHYRHDVVGCRRQVGGEVNRDAQGGRGGPLSIVLQAVLPAGLGAGRRQGGGAGGRHIVGDALKVVRGAEEDVDLVQGSDGGGADVLGPDLHVVGINHARSFHYPYVAPQAGADDVAGRDDVVACALNTRQDGVDDEDHAHHRRYY